MRATLQFRAWLYAHLQVHHHDLFREIVWNLWKWRNNRVFDQEQWQPMEVLRQIHEDTLEFRRWGSGVVEHAPFAVHGGDRVMLHTYGSWQPGLNKIGGDGVIRDRLGRWVSGFSMEAGAVDAFKAEIVAIHMGLLHAWELGFDEVNCYLDCSEVQQVITNNKDVHSYWHEDGILQVRAVLARSWSVSVIHVHRDRNTVADALAKLAIT